MDNTYLWFHCSSTSWLHDERSYIRVGREGSRAGSRRTDFTSVYNEGREGSALLHQALQHRWVSFICMWSCSAVAGRTQRLITVAGCIVIKHLVPKRVQWKVVDHSSALNLLHELLIVINTICSGFVTLQINWKIAEGQTSSDRK